MGDEKHDRKDRLKEKAKEELRLLLVITTYLALLFISFLTYRRLISRELGVSSFRYGFAIIEALVIAKVILIGKAMGLGKRETSGALILTVLRSAVLYGLLIAAFSVLEHTIEGLIHGKNLAASLAEVADQGIYEILSRALVLFVALIPFFAMWKLDERLGERKLFEMFFRGRSPQTHG
jgi:hypothetical protein